MQPVIEVNHLTFRYPDGRLALDDVHFKIEVGEKTVLLGANGAGKSTLLLHLNGILTGEGSVRVEGVELNQKTLPSIRARVGMIFQNPDDQLFSPTVYEDVAYGPYYQGLSQADMEERVKAALAAVHMEGFAKRMPFHLSNGEKKRIAIATVLSMRPPVLAFDEPTAGLDPRGQREMAELFMELPQTMLIATHDLDFARKVARRALVLNQGKLVADAPLTTILENPDFLLQYGLC